MSTSPGGGRLELGEQALAVFRAVVERPSDDVPQLAEHLRLPAALVDHELERLARAGLLSTGAAVDARVLAVEPTVGLALLAERAAWEMQQRIADLERSQRAVSELLACLTRPAAQTSTRTLSGPDLHAWVELLVRHGRTRVAALVDPHWLALLARHLLDSDALAAAADRGVAVHAVVDEAAAADPALLRLAQLVSGQGHWRGIGSVPVGLLLVDDDAAVLLHAPDPALPAGDAAADRATYLAGPGSVRAMAGLFESLWENAPALDLTDPSAPPVPVAAPAAAVPAGVTEQQVRLLRLMARGLKDDAIARNLGVSLRTVTRLIRETFDALGTSSRFEAGAAAAERGLV